MTTEVVQESKPSYGVTFTKKVSDGNYGGDEVSAWVSADVPLGATSDAIATALEEAAFVAKATVYTQLGVEFENQDGILKATVARVQRAFPGTKLVSEPFDATPEESGAIGRPVVRVKGKKNGEFPAWFIEAAAKDGVTEVYDNRDQLSDPAKSRRPHFKAVVGDFAYWPPKGK